MITITLHGVTVTKVTKMVRNTKQTKTALLAERHFIEIALSFANSEPEASVKMAESLFWNSFGIGYEPAGSTDGDEKNIRKWQPRIHRLLTEIVDDPRLTPEFEITINRQVLNKTWARPQLQGGQMAMQYQATGVVQAARLGIALLFHTGLAKRLRQCKRDECNRFFLAEGQRSRAKYCPGTCAEAEKRTKNAARQARFHAKRKDRRK